MTPASRVSTGIPLLDLILGGGFPGGSLVCLLTDSMSNAEVFLYHFSGTRETVFFVTDQGPEEQETRMRDLGLQTASVRFLGGARGRYLIEPEMKKIREEGKSLNIVVNTFSSWVETAESAEGVRKLLARLRETVASTGSVALLFFYRGTHPKDIENLVVNSCDVVMSIESRMEARGLETTLSIPKIRGMSPIQSLRVVVGERIVIDTTRQIA
ncbi:MAG: hypothetical protein QXT68_09000 [Halobacteria archaeon]